MQNIQITNNLLFNIKVDNPTVYKGQKLAKFIKDQLNNTDYIWIIEEGEENLFKSGIENKKILLKDIAYLQDDIITMIEKRLNFTFTEKQKIELSNKIGNNEIIYYNNGNNDKGLFINISNDIIEYLYKGNTPIINNDITQDEKDFFYFLQKVPDEYFYIAEIKSNPNDSYSDWLITIIYPDLLKNDINGAGLRREEVCENIFSEYLLKINNIYNYIVSIIDNNGNLINQNSFILENRNKSKLENNIKDKILEMTNNNISEEDVINAIRKIDKTELYL